MNSRYSLIAAGAALALITALLLAGCGGSGSAKTTVTQPATISTSLSDPPTCASSTGGAYTSIFVTIKDVQISTSSTAGPNDPGWVDLTPNLSGSPQQIDLLGQANNQCFLASLGSNTQIQPGTYQQIRIILTTTPVNGDKCGGAANCVKLSSDGSIHALQLSSEAQTGIKIPGPSIAGGNITVAPGDTKDLNIDFDGCASIVVLQGNNQYRLKPVLHAGIVSTTSVSINGKVINQTTSAAVVGGKTVVALEQKDSAGIDRVVMQTVADSTGAFAFCPVPAGTYDVVAVAIDGSNIAYAATIVTGVQSGNTVGNMPLFAAQGPALIDGTITTAASASAAAAADMTISALLQAGTTTYTIPLAANVPPGGTATLTTAASTTTLTCPANTDCGSYELAVPAANPTVGAFSTSGFTFMPGTGTATYTVEAQAFNPMQSGSTFCSPSVMTTTVATTAGMKASATTLAFTGCQ